MLRNEEEVLPLRKEDKVAVFGRCQIDYYRSGTGSGGAVNVYLYERGAHTNVARSFFAESMSNLFTACDIDSRTRTYREIIALTWLSVDHPATEEDNIAVAKAADKLMTIAGIEASFAILRAEDTVTISARSHDKINVQLIMQRMGGGGHFDMAGAQLANTNLKEACEKLKVAIDEYLNAEEASAAKKDA